MRQEYPRPFYMLWHLIWGLLIAYFMAFIALHGYSTRFDDLSVLEAVWRTISYVIPKWHLVIIPAGFIVVLLSGSVYGLIRKLQGEERKTSTAVYFILTVLGAGFFSLVFSIFSLFILIPVYLECQILSNIVGMPDKPSAEKRKIEDIILS